METQVSNWKVVDKHLIWYEYVSREYFSRYDNMFIEHQVLFATLDKLPTHWVFTDPAGYKYIAPKVQKAAYNPFFRCVAMKTIQEEDRSTKAVTLDSSWYLSPEDEWAVSELVPEVEAQ